MRAWLGITGVALLLAAGCAGAAPDKADEALACVSPTDALAGETAHGFTEPVQVETAMPPRTDGRTRVVYLNRYARAYVAGTDDAQAGVSSVLSAQKLDHVAIGGFQQGDDAWQSVVTCIRSQYAIYDVAVTDIRPVTPGYVEAHFGGTGAEVGLTNGAGGIAPIDAVHCAVIEGAPVFVFTDLFGSDVRSICEVGAHEIAHTFSLDHEYECKDPMTYIEGCGYKSFQQAAAACGESAARPCNCGRTSQSSVIVLRNMLGDLVSDTVPPTVELLPLVADPSGIGTRVQVRAHDDNGALSAIELHLAYSPEGKPTEEVIACGTGRIPCTLDGELASFDVPPMRSDAQVWAVAQDTGGNRTSTDQVTLAAADTLAPMLAIVLAPLAATYEPSGVVELQALVLTKAPLVEVTVVWTDTHGTVHELPMCPLGDAAQGRWGIAVHLGTAPGPRTFHVRATDDTGVGTQSTEESISLSGP